MSYDLYFFRLPEGVTIEEVNTYIEEGGLDEWEVELERLEDEGEGLPPLPPTLHDAEMGEEQWMDILSKPWIAAHADMLKGQNIEKLLKKDRDDWPEAVTEFLESSFEAEMEAGMMPVWVSYSSDVGGFAARMAAILEVLGDESVAIYDPQTETAVDATNARDVLLKSAAGSEGNFNKILRDMKAKGFTTIPQPEEDEE
jgi:hypothetical protein